MENFAEINFLDIEETKEYIDFIQKVIRQAFVEEGIDKLNWYMNIILTNPENIRKLNKEYRQIDQETDVLSFPMFEKEEIEDRKGKENKIPEVLGDVIISIPRVKQQAIEYGHSFERELAYMLVHGFCHLIGYDHIEEEDKKIMRKKEENILEKLRITR